ncbi:unnamed protein product [Lactuca virosa]|uniref:Uncharacterized protein n=1 Tax=Lactuca virosa TaxID=75947 RepID=A0AAU9MEK0_9ASTR|nr:unnamed protein product [Lactuca virosa]
MNLSHLMYKLQWIKRELWMIFCSLIVQVVNIEAAIAYWVWSLVIVKFIKLLIVGSMTYLLFSSGVKIYLEVASIGFSFS